MDSKVNYPVTEEQRKTVNDIQIPDIFKKENVADAHELIEAVQQTQIDRENNTKHLRDLTMQAQAMDKQEQEASVRGMSSDVMFMELLNRQMYYEQKMNKITEVLGDA